MAFSGCIAYKSAALTAQNLTTAAAMVFNSEVYDTDAWHDTSSNTSRLTVPSGVAYAQFMGGVQIDNVAGNSGYILDILKNGAALTGAIPRTFDTTNHTTVYAQVCTAPLAVSPGDYFELRVQVFTDTSVDIAAGSWFAGWQAPAAPETFAGACILKSADQGAADYSAGAVVAFDEELYDVGGWHDNVTNNSRLTIPSGVSYVQLSGWVGCTAFTATQWARAQILKNGSAMTQPLAVNNSAGTSTIQRWGLGSPPLAVSPGDYFELHFQTQTDASITLTSTRNWLSIRKVA